MKWVAEFCDLTWHKQCLLLNPYLQCLKFIIVTFLTKSWWSYKMLAPQSVSLKNFEDQLSASVLSYVSLGICNALFVQMVTSFPLLTTRNRRMTRASVIQLFLTLWNLALWVEKLVTSQKVAANNWAVMQYWWMNYGSRHVVFFVAPLSHLHHHLFWVHPIPNENYAMWLFRLLTTTIYQQND